MVGMGNYIMILYIYEQHVNTNSEEELEMEIEGKSEYSNFYSMYEGIGPWSYAENSYYQRKASEIAQQIICQEIINKLDIKLVFHSGEGQSAAEFQVFFNDLVSNDFNTLFKLFPPKRRYYAAGVPGSFHDRLFPEPSLCIAFSAFAFYWLSNVPGLFGSVCGGLGAIPGCKSTISCRWRADGSDLTSLMQLMEIPKINSSQIETVLNIAPALDFVAVPEELEMEIEGKCEYPNSYSTYEGNGPYSYAENSYYQRKASEIAQEIICQEIINKLDIKQVFHSGLFHSFCIADFGCATGPNAFLADQAIIEAVELKLKSGEEGQNAAEFQVFFNDHVSNDFNTLFKLLPPERRYCAAGVPGSFHDRLFPKASLPIAYSSFALHWLSNMPKEVKDKTSKAWNGGRIHYTSERREVLQAYSDQFAEDLARFLAARAQELMGGGLMALIFPGLSDNICISQNTAGLVFQLLGSCLMEMVQKVRKF
ncbi:hypothetical protein Patl1_15233 [Pistacia atlantica]|uniref:Uncharacterized protein n=1 Tax=Pistacia atlantica TaxID=434234 RepID=A0ACC1B5J2_9ROSI|nr:hypothetical protein Patl1_15233 [Pistacia atlantica]